MFSFQQARAVLGGFVCFMVCEVIFMGWLKIVIQLLDFHLVTLILHRSVFHAVTCANNTQSYTYVVFYESVDECSKTRLRHVVTQCINIPRVFYSSCIKTCHQVCHQKKLGCHQVSWQARAMIHPYPKASPNVLKKHHHENLIRSSWHYLLRRC